MSIRLRLTLWYVALLAVILITFSGTLFAILSFSLFDQVDRTLQTRAAEVQNGADAALQVQSESFATPGIYVQLATPDGSPVSSSENLGSQVLDMPPAAVDRAKSGVPVFVNLTVANVPLRAYVAPLSARGQVIGIIEVAQPLQSVDDTLRRLGVLLAFGIVGGLVLAFVVGAFIAQRALAPIDRMTQAARGIANAGDLSRRIEQPATSDEVGRLASTFNGMLERIEQLFKAQQRFVADVSHELRSPLTAIRGHLDLVRRGAFETEADREDSIAAIDAESARMQRMVQDLLLLARADAGIQIQKNPVEVDTLLLDVYRQARMMAKGVQVSLGAEDQAMVLGDVDRLKQLLLNLVDNAIKYTPGGGEVTLSLERDKEWVRVAVADTGVGIPEQDLPKIFDRFYRVDKSRTRNPSDDGVGAGLGLAIVKTIVDAHGGRIDVSSQAGKGTTFTVWLPLASDN
ncbi:MAG: HAMP domain-containing histidine kinase [Chloroflexi bacterium]|nr:HAMP domain-containing histidine kinase [Chloroflexota bacterium]